ncbi:hypothetical protein AB0J68_08915, partial [Micromonospora sp. NPDC049580]|uniref:hypothetical protein n=1 Tax=Micromonospora sp. NPDC049580 TaxID=3154832 RepID=UPI003413FC9D
MPVSTSAARAGPLIDSPSGEPAVPSRGTPLAGTGRTICRIRAILWQRHEQILDSFRQPLTE